jgi:hypothetical protein
MVCYDEASAFSDETAELKFQVSGLCQRCQDEASGKKEGRQFQRWGSAGLKRRIGLGKNSDPNRSGWTGHAFAVPAGIAQPDLSRM